MRWFFIAGMMWTFTPTLSAQCLPGPIFYPPIQIMPISYPILLPVKPREKMPSLQEAPAQIPKIGKNIPPKPPLLADPKSESIKPLPPESEMVVEVFPVKFSGPQKEENGRVKFFNHSDRDLVLEINQKEVKLNSGQFLKLKLPTDFVWKEKGGEARKQSIPPDAQGLDIVIRR